MSPFYSDTDLSEDDTKRVIVMGAFRHGRTDFGLIREVAQSDQIEELVVAGHGGAQLAASCQRLAAARVVHYPYLNRQEVARLIGPNTVALIPHHVNAYTVSQDPMKLYQFLAFGIPVLVPRLLCGGHIRADGLIRFEHGDAVQPLLRAAFRLRSALSDWRRAFGTEHSWAAGLDGR